VPPPVSRVQPGQDVEDFLLCRSSLGAAGGEVGHGELGEVQPVQVDRPLRVAVRDQGGAAAKESDSLLDEAWLAGAVIEPEQIRTVPAGRSARYALI
jgi:hypothetical protein